MKIAVIGKGNVGTHLCHAFSHMEMDCTLVDSRTLNNLPQNVETVIISVSDSAIAGVAEALYKRLPDFRGTVAHTAGSVPMDVLAPFFKNYGVLYPLQTFNRDIPMEDYSDIPFFIEANSENALNSLRKIASRVSGKVFDADSNKRKLLHLASVFACNFTNAMYRAGEELLGDAGFSFDVLRPLISRTLLKALSHSPSVCQTGPASRGDKEVMEGHLRMLEDRPDLKDIYRLISDYIILRN